MHERPLSSLELWGGRARAAEYDSRTSVDWNDPLLVHIDRIRYIGEDGIYDFSYAYGTLSDGRKIRVNIPVYQVLTRRTSIRAALVAAARRDGVYLKGLGGLDCISVND